jgi:ParB/RepB/Spo0J family partition protein
MAATADTGDHKVSRSDVFLVDPRALVVNWAKNLSRRGQEPEVNEDLIRLARSMMPRKGSPGDPGESTGQLQPILCRPLPDRRVEVVGGWRRVRAALYLLESGLCPDFKIKYVSTRMSDSEAALANMTENLEREDPTPLQLAYAARSLTEDHGLAMEQVARSLRQSVSWLERLLDLIGAPAVIQNAVESKELPVTVALELVNLPAGEQIAAFSEQQTSGEKLTVAGVKAKRRKHAETNGSTRVPSRGLKDLKAFLESKLEPDGVGRNLAKHLVQWLAGHETDAQMEAAWKREFKKSS